MLFARPVDSARYIKMSFNLKHRFQIETSVVPNHLGTKAIWYEQVPNQNAKVNCTEILLSGRNGGPSSLRVRNPGP
jgi:hypothetical protein